jgi:hypothetical protein
MSPQAGELLVNEVAPRIQSLAPSLNPVGCEDHEELCQDAIAIAAGLLQSVETRGKRATPGTIAFFALGLVRQGRRSTGLSKTDVMHPAAQVNRRSSMVSLDAPLATDGDGEPSLCLHDVLSARSEDPGLSATRRLDWDGLTSSLDPKTREVLVCLAEGDDLTTLVPRLKRSRSALQIDKQRLAELVREHLGQSILSQVQEQPRWRPSIDAVREKAACRYERQNR